MSQIRENKIQTIVNADAYNLAGDLASMADTSNVIIKVSSQAERDALAKVAGKCVIRLDLPGLPIERCDGANWLSTPAALGRVAESIQPSSFNGFSAGEFFADAIGSVPLKAGRKYRIDYRVDIVAPTGASIAAVFNIKKSLTTDTGSTGTAIDAAITAWSPPVQNSGGSYNFSWIYSPAANETVRVLVTSGRIAGSSLYNLSNRELTINDEGAQY